MQCSLMNRTDLFRKHGARGRKWRDFTFHSEEENKLYRIITTIKMKSKQMCLVN